MIMFYGLLRNVRQHGIGAAKGDDGGFTEKNSFPENSVPLSQEKLPRALRATPKSRSKLPKFSERAAKLVWRSPRLCSQDRHLPGERFTAAKIMGQNFGTKQSNHGRSHDNHGKRDVKKINRDEGHGRDRPHDGVLQRFAPDANDGSGDDREDGRF